jgi:hypothetical protein
MLDSGLLGNLNSSEIHSGYLARTSNVKRKVGGVSDGQWYFYATPSSIDMNDVQSHTIYAFNQPHLNKGRPIRLNQISTGLGPVTPAVVPIILGEETAPASGYYSVKLQFNYSKYVTLQQSFLNSISSISYGPGTGSLYLVGTSFTSSYFYDYNSWIPSELVFNKNSIGIDGDLENNSTTILNLPSFDFDIIDSQSGTPATSDRFGFSGSLFKQDYNILDGVIQSNAGNAIGYSYNIYSEGEYGTRALSGSVSSSVDVGWVPQISQSSQYISFDPNLPYNPDFYNTPYNPLINNATSSVRNTYVERVEYDTGETTPSNVIPIRENTAQKASIPDSFYVQKSIINPRYVGTKMQSANYNFYTPSNPNKINTKNRST